MTTMTHQQRIARLNDLCRTTGLGCRMVQTSGICALPEADQAAIRARVAQFDDFTEANDPYGERDFGAFEHDGQRIFWKIDYYALDGMHASPDPADSMQTLRVLTILLAEEY